MRVLACMSDNTVNSQSNAYGCADGVEEGQSAKSAYVYTCCIEFDLEVEYRVPSPRRVQYHDCEAAVSIASAQWEPLARYVLFQVATSASTPPFSATVEIEGNRAHSANPR
jgi:hypothetical protein